MTLYTVATGNIVQAADVDQVVNWLQNFAYNVKDYGAKGDGKTITDGAITTGTATLTSASAGFTSADVGKQITVNGAGASAANLNTTISGFTNTTTVTLATNAGTTVSGATFFYGTDDTTPIANARSAAHSAGGGTVVYPFAVYISGNQTLYSNVLDDLCGSTIKLKAGANTDLFSAQTSSINLSAAANTSILGTLNKFSIRNGILDGNKANQTSGTSYPLRFYGYDFALRDLEILNGYTGGVLIDWNYATGIPGPSDNMEAVLDTIKIHDNNGIGLQMGGPHDSRLNNILSWSNTSHGFHFAPNAAALLCSNIHPYFLSTGVSAVGCLCEANACNFSDCEFEGSDFAQFVLLGWFISIQGGMIFGNTGYDGVGLQLGQVAGGTPIPGQILQSGGVKTAFVANYNTISTTFVDNNTGGAINPVNEYYNVVNAVISQTAGTGIVGGDLNAADTYNIQVRGLTPDGTVGKSGGVRAASNGSTTAFTLYDLTNGRVLAIDQYGNMYPGGGVNLNAGLYFIASNTAASLATGGTITCLGIANLAVAPTADVTGVIMQAGFAGQFTIVNNASAFTITFAASGTSHVANGVSCKISPNSACIFYYNGTTSLWQPTSYTLLPTQSATAVAIAASGTIAVTDLDVSRVAPTGNVASIILTAGTYAGQKITVVNESAFTVTFAASGTSHVADGISAIIAANRAMDFTWDSGTSLWYHS